MTGRDAEREQLWQITLSHRPISSGPGFIECACRWVGAFHSDHLADVLLLVVDRIANERAVAEGQHLTTALADLLRLTYDVQLDSGTPAERKESERVADVFRARIAEHCRERDHRVRADRAALRASNGAGTT